MNIRKFRRVPDRPQQGHLREEKLGPVFDRCGEIAHFLGNAVARHVIRNPAAILMDQLFQFALGQLGDITRPLKPFILTDTDLPFQKAHRGHVVFDKVADLNRGQKIFDRIGPDLCFVRLHLLPERGIDALVVNENSRDRHIMIGRNRRLLKQGLEVSVAYQYRFCQGKVLPLILQFLQNSAFVELDPLRNDVERYRVIDRLPLRTRIEKDDPRAGQFGKMVDGLPLAGPPEQITRQIGGKVLPDKTVKEFGT